MNKIRFTFLAMVFALGLNGQELLTLSDAVRITLENDYNIKVAEKSAEVAENNTSIYANDYLPQVVANSGMGFRSQSSDVEMVDGTERSIDGSTTMSYDASIGLNYTLFDGMYRAYNFEKSQELYNLSQLQVRQVIESTLLDLFTSYYQVANLTEATESQRQTLEISKVRLLRAEYGSEYGTTTQLDVLNAQVDVNTDSINLLNNRQSLANAKRSLNVLMARDVNAEFNIDTTVAYEILYAVDTLMSMAKDENIRLLTTQKSLEMSGIDIKLFQSNRIPTIGLSGSYAWSSAESNGANQILHQSILGPQAQVSLSWNIFDGGRTKTGVQNARITAESQMIIQEQTEKQVERDVINAYTTYENSLFVMKAEKANLVTNRRNFDRSVEQYQLGQLASVEFRQAQLNLLYAENRYNQSKYQAKIYELALFKLTGELMNMKF